MSIKGGPRVVNDRLILCCDSISAKSYAGESTTNVSAANRNSAYTWTNSGSWVLTTFTYGNSPVGHPPINPDEYGNVSVMRGHVTSTGSQHFGTGYNNSISSSTVYTYSVWYYQSNKTGIGAPYCRSNQSNTNLGSLRYKGQTGSSNWPANKWIRLEREFTTQGSDTDVYISNYIGSAVGDTMYLAAPQLEQKSYATPFTSSSRTGSWTDLSGFGNNGTFTNMTGTAKLHRRKGSVILNNNFLNFDGSNDYVDFGNVAAFSNAESFSVEAWFKYQGSGSGYFPIISKEGSSQFGYGLKIDGGVTGAPLVYAIATGSTNRYQYASPTLSSSNWYCVCATFNASAGSITLYLNGSQNHGDYAVQGSFSGAQTSNNLRVATNGSAYFTGNVAGAKIYSRVLTAAEVKSNFDAQKGRFGL